MPRPRLLLLGACASVLQGCVNFYLAPRQWEKGFGRPAAETATGNPHLPHHLQALPRPDSLPWPEQLALARPLLEHWAALPLGNWAEKGKVSEPRTLLARLLLNPTDSPALALLGSLKPWAEPGSDWALHPNGDYDFTEIVLAGLVAHPQLRQRLPAALLTSVAENLLTEPGEKLTTAMPGTLGLLRDSENHMLMREGARQLRLQVLAAANPALEAARQRHAQRLLPHLRALAHTGSFEFAANPYCGYTFSALLLLHTATTDAQLRQACQDALDVLVHDLNLSMLGGKRAGPFRRRYERARLPRLDQHPALAVICTWKMLLQRKPIALQDVRVAEHQALVAAISTYLPPPSLLSDSLGTGSFVQVGHGPLGCPELVSRGDGWMLAAGGSYRGLPRQVVPQPIVLMLNDTARSLNSHIHLPLPAKNLRANRTGLWQQVAVANCAPQVPLHLRPIAEKGPWKLVQASPSLHVAVHSTPRLGVLVVLPGSADAVAPAFEALSRQSLDPRKTRLVLPQGGELLARPKAARNRWVILRTPNEPRPERRFDRWPRYTHQALHNGN